MDQRTTVPEHDREVRILDPSDNRNHPSEGEPVTSVNTIPPDDGVRHLTVVDPDDETLAHVAVGRDTYTFLIRGEDTAGKYALTDMLIPAGAGPPPHPHDFEEMFHVLDGEIEVTIRGETSRAGIGETVNIPALAPHSFHNSTDQVVRVL
jgi:quercetin dioxygenase-like cupin family protein